MSTVAAVQDSPDSLVLGSTLPGPGLWTFTISLGCAEAVSLQLIKGRHLTKPFCVAGAAASVLLREVCSAAFTVYSRYTNQATDLTVAKAAEQLALCNQNQVPSATLVMKIRKTWSSMANRNKALMAQMSDVGHAGAKVVLLGVGNGQMEPLWSAAKAALRRVRGGCSTKDIFRETGVALIKTSSPDEKQGVVTSYDTLRKKFALLSYIATTAKAQAKAFVGEAARKAEAREVAPDRSLWCRFIGLVFGQYMFTLSTRINPWQ